MSQSDTSFLSRWSRRKVRVREGVAGPDEATAPLSALAGAGTAAITPVAVPAAPAAQPPLDQAATQPPPAVAPAPTLSDVAALSIQSDFTRFVTRGVAPEVKNAALKKLFTDPHFNLMDGLDTYIDDYGKPDPLPAGMLRKMVQSHRLGLFDDEKKADGSQVTVPAPPAAAVTPGAVADAASQCPDAGLDAQCHRQPAAGCASARSVAADDSAPQ